MLATGGLDRLAASVGRYAERAMVLAEIEGGNPDGLICRRIGPPMVFGRLWQETGWAVLEEMLGARKFEFAVERAVFVSVLHRIMVIDAGKLADDARYDGIFVLRTNARISPLQAVLRYRDFQVAIAISRRTAEKCRPLHPPAPFYFAYPVNLAACMRKQRSVV